MKISLNWLQDYLDLSDLAPEKIGEVLTEIGLEVEGMEKFESIKGGLEGVVVGRVLKTQKHPNADNLTITKVDVNGDEDLQIICGAPNVAEDQKVLVAMEGTTLYGTDGNPFKIKRAKIRGEESRGMICAEDELGLGDSHEGIMVLPDDAAVGTLAKEYFQIETDTVYDIGLTPNRSDATSHIGVAKDLAAALKINYNSKHEVRTPLSGKIIQDEMAADFKIVVEDQEGCPRYSGILLKNIKVGPSPIFIRNRLESIGVRSINNIVDITNFVLHEMGQPLHAFDLDQISDRTILVKNLAEGTIFKTLDEVERKLSSKDLMICDGTSRGLCIAGVFGGIGSGVTNASTNVFLESAHFNAKRVRVSSMTHNLRTDAAMCFEKGSDPNITVEALLRAVELMQAHAGAEVDSKVFDLYPNPILRNEIQIRYQRINELIGVTMAHEEINKILSALDIEVLRENEYEANVAIPTNKADVIREVDVIEEVLRIYGFNKVPVPDKLKSVVAGFDHFSNHANKERVSNFLVARGFSEMMGLSMTESSYFDNDQVRQGGVLVNNTSNIKLDLMRPNMLVSALEVVVHNQNRQTRDIRLFEHGKSYYKVGDQYEEVSHLSIVQAGDKKIENWQSPGAGPADFYSIKGVVESLLTYKGVTTYQSSELEDHETFEYGLKFHRGDNIIAEFGKVRQEALQNLVVKGDLLFADIRWDILMKAAKNNHIIVNDISKFPSVRRDLALVVDNYINFNDIVYIARKSGGKILQDIILFDIYKNEEHLGKGKKSYAIGLIFRDNDRTLKDKEVDKVIQKMVSTFERKINAYLRK